MSHVVHARIPPRRGGRRAATWWGKAWVRAVEESAFSEGDLVAGRRLARAGRVGQIAVGPGAFLAAVEEGDDVWTVTGALAAFDGAAETGFCEAVAAESGRIAALLAGDLPHSLVEHAEEAGAELLPYGGEIEVGCTCEAWLDPCPHALGVLLQLTVLIEQDPFVLLTLRGLARDELLARLHAREVTARPDAPQPETDDLDLEAAADAALRAARLLQVLEDPEARLDHLF